VDGKQGSLHRKKPYGCDCILLASQSFAKSFLGGFLFIFLDLSKVVGLVGETDGSKACDVV